MIAFLAILFILVVIYALTKENKEFRKSKNDNKEGFDVYKSPSDHKVNIPVNVIPPQIPPPPARNMSEDNATPYNEPGSLPIAPYEQIAHASPLPYQDPTLIKAKRQEIINTLEDIKGFLAFEAQEISENSDPSIQLPLNNARADFKRLQDEVYLLQRNPGLQPDLTETNLYEIQQNLAYLQRTVRLIGTAGPLQGPKYEFVKNVNVKEGFLSENEEKKGYESGDIASPEDLNDFIAKVSAEIIRLSASGTTDPVINARVVALTQIKQNVQTILDQLQSGALLSVEIPILKKDIVNALPILGKPSEPLPQIIQTLQLPQGLANLLPTNIQNDPSTLRQINTLIDKYANDIVKGLSASISLKYTSPREATIINNDDENSTITKSGFPSVADLNNLNKLTLTPNNNQVKDEYSDKPQDASRGPSHFDWKKRALEISSQVKKRGLDQEDFGIMKEGTKVSDDFSWKGYARMICTRLQATMDPGLPETCGCPPMDWKGWKIAKY